MQILHRNYLLRSCYKKVSVVAYSRNKHIEADAQKYTPIYSYPHIKLFALINRLKLYQTGITLVSIPSSVVAASLNILTAEHVFSVSAIGKLYFLFIFSCNTIIF